MKDGKSNNDNSTSVSTWKAHPSSLRMRRINCSAVAIDDHRMVITGGNYDNRKLSSVELLDIRVLGGTQQLPDMNSTKRDHQSIVHGNYIYVIGGYGECLLRSVERININKISTSKWEVVAPMKEARCSFAAVKDDNYIFVFAGYCRGHSFAHSYVEGTSEWYDILNNKWKSIAPMKQPRTDHAAVTVGRKAYVFGGMKSKKCLASMEIFDTQSRQWEDHTGADMPIALSYMKGVVVKDMIIVIGGRKNNASDNLNHDILIYDTINNLWQIINEVTMNIPRRNFAATVLQHDTIFVVGGTNDNGPRHSLNSIEYAAIHVLKRSTSNKELKNKVSDDTRQNQESLRQLTNHQSGSNTVRIKEEENTEVHEVAPSQAAMATLPATNKHNSSPTYSSSKTLYERVIFLEESVGQKERSLKRRVEDLETNIFGEVLSSGVSIVKRIKRLESELS